MRHEYIDIKEDHYRAEIKVFPKDVRFFGIFFDVNWWKWS